MEPVFKAIPINGRVVRAQATPTALTYALGLVGTTAYRSNPRNTVAFRSNPLSENEAAEGLLALLADAI